MATIFCGKGSFSVPSWFHPKDPLRAGDVQYHDSTLGYLCRLLPRVPFPFPPPVCPSHKVSILSKIEYLLGKTLF